MMQRPGLLNRTRVALSDPLGNLKSLNISQDDKGVLRVGGRLEVAPSSAWRNYPDIKLVLLGQIYFWVQLVFVILQIPVGNYLSESSTYSELSREVDTTSSPAFSCHPRTGYKHLPHPAYDSMPAA
ncbi:hypothetical protein TNCV_4322791 [Trichonephila clavipes]|nr:hypothetical protein TNCV_4322791 [Trichonephila clavipes]